MVSLSKERSMSYSTMVLTTGLLGYSYLIYNKLKMDAKLNNAVIAETLETLKNNPAVTSLVGNQFVITTGLLKSLYIRADKKKENTEFAFSINGTKNKSIEVFVSATSKPHREINSDEEWQKLEKEFYLPDKHSYKIIEESSDKKLLEKIGIRDDDLFWKIDYIEGISNRKDVIDIKTDIKTDYSTQNLFKRNNLYSVFQCLQVK